MIRQGDILIVPGTVPADAKRMAEPENGRYVLADGEATGHAHVAVADDVEMFERDGNLWLRVLQPTEIHHEEHAPLPLDIGDYEVRRQREYTPEGIRRVAD